MIHRLFHKTPDKPTFPDARDLPGLSPQQAMSALGLLRLLVDQGAAEVYTAASGIQADGLYFWNVWIEAHVIPGGKRIPLRDWAAHAVCVDYTPDDAA